MPRPRRSRIAREPIPVQRVQTGVRMEKRLLKVLKALAELLDLSLGDLLEGIVLHAFEGKAPFGDHSRRRIAELKKIYGLDLQAADSHHLVERPAARAAAPGQRRAAGGGRRGRLARLRRPQSRPPGLEAVRAGVALLPRGDALVGACARDLRAARPSAHSLSRTYSSKVVTPSVTRSRHLSRRVCMPVPMATPSSSSASSSPSMASASSGEAVI